MSRRLENLQILEMIKDYVEENPDQRFNQVLFNLDIIDNPDGYNDEGDVILKRVYDRLEFYNEGKDD